MLHETRSEGLTRSEQYLGKLARSSFLSLWSFQNLYRDTAKELADLVVKCGPYVLIFSDKSVKFQYDIELEVAWQRWYNRAVLSSAKQLKRAAHWIEKHPDRIFWDAKCESQVAGFDDGEPKEIFRIAIANGAAEACLRHFRQGSGSLIVAPSEDPLKPAPFTVSNPIKNEGFVHVFDEAHLHIVLQELDTITDFVQYLRARRRVIERESLVVAASEEDLLAVYLKDINDEGEHDWVITSGKSLKDGDLIGVEEGAYRSFREAKPYARKKTADKVSYLWDRLIEKFAKNLRAGTLAPLPESLASVDGRHGGAELGLRYMALEGRLERRNHAEAIRTAFFRLRDAGSNRFFRAMLDRNGEKETAFCILLLKRSAVPDGVSFEDYREFRCRMLGAYAEGLSERYRNLKRVVGLATEGEFDGRRTEDLVYLEAPEWTEEKVARLRNMEAGFDIFRSDLELKKMGTPEYPSVSQIRKSSFEAIPYGFVPSVEERIASLLPTKNRRQRRAEKSKRKKK